MIAVQSRVFDVASGLSTVLSIRERNSYSVVLFFRNRGDLELSLQIEESADGGSTWSLVDTAFTLAAAGEDGDVAVKLVASDDILRVRGSGGGGDRDLEIAFVRDVNESATWTAPVL